MDFLEALAQAATGAAVAAGKQAQATIHHHRRTSRKGLRDIVTDADFAAQALIVGRLRQRFPDHAFLTEETDESLPTTGDVLWVIDPIDGTTNYSRGLPSYCVSIAAVAEGQVQAGAIYDPARDELFEAAAGRGARANGRALAVSDVNQLSEAIVGLDWAHEQKPRRATVDTVARLADDVTSLRAIGSATMALAWVAAGRLDAYFNANLQPWDLAAGSLLLAEAGGRLTDNAGLPWTWSLAPAGCLASNGLIHDAALSYLG